MTTTSATTTPTAPDDALLCAVERCLAERLGAARRMHGALGFVVLRPGRGRAQLWWTPSGWYGLFHAPGWRDREGGGTPVVLSVPEPAHPTRPSAIADALAAAISAAEAPP